MIDNSEKNEGLLLDLKNGSVDAFQEIFETYWHNLYLIARSKVQSHDDAEEIVQDVFSGLWEKRATLSINHLSSYLQTSVRNRVIDLIRSRLTQKKYWDYYRKFLPQSQPQTEMTVAYRDLTGSLEAAIDGLPAQSGKVFRLSRLEGRSNKEIAQLLHVSEKAIEYHLTKSTRALKLALKDFTLLVAMLFTF